jgi:hypothetical protein
LFSKEKTNAMIRIPLQPKGLGFKPFPEFYFPSTNEMDENKLPLCIFKKKIPKNIFFEKNHVLKQWFKLPQGIIMFLKEKGA